MYFTVNLVLFIFNFNIWFKIAINNLFFVSLYKYINADRKMSAYAIMQKTRSFKKEYGSD